MTSPRTDLATRSGLPDALRVLLLDYPRDIWTSHRNFDGLTRFWLNRHLLFRRVLGDLRAGGEGFLDGAADPQAHARETAQRMGFLLNGLHGHHQIEDSHYFPQLAALEPRIASGFELLDADHHALDAHIHALAADTNALLRAIRDGAPGRSEAGALHDRLVGFSGFLERHLTDEEDLVVPVILHHAPDL